MAEIEITDEQRAYLDDLRESLRADHVDRYGHVRPADALQYLIDVNEGDVASDEAPDARDGTDDGADADDARSRTDDGADADDGEGDEARLDAMMSLLDTYDDRWSESDADDARYEVELPDGSVERVRTRDDVRSLLFRHYR